MSGGLRRDREVALAHDAIERVECRGPHAHQHFAGFGCRVRKGRTLQHLQAAVGANLNSFHDGMFSMKFRDKIQFRPEKKNDAR
jgi:hypothetical protein